LLSITVTMLGLLAIMALARWRLPAVLATLLIVFSLSYRMIDVAYLDVFGPIYATELDKFVGGNGAAPYFVASVLCLALPLFYLFRDRSLIEGVRAPLPTTAYLNTGARLGFWSVTALIAALYIDMMRIGVIPLFVGMDRLGYNTMAGVLHNPVYGLGFLPAGALGILTVLPRLQGKSYHVPSIAVFLVLLLYWALTGNRFSAFLLAICYYALPFAAVVVLQRNGLLVSRRRRDAWSVLVSAKVVVPIVTIIGALAIIGLLLNSYYDVRNYADPMFEIFQRIFVQPVQLFAVQWELVQLGQSEGLDRQVLNEVLLDPLDPNANTTMRYLMVRELGYFRATELFNYGAQYAGGYPEILIELFGVYLAIPVLLLLGLGTAFMARLIIRNILRGYLLSAMMAIYVYFAFSLAYIGGMLNSLYAPSLALKVLGLVIATLVERSIMERALARHTRAARAPVMTAIPQGIA
jgi:hypothetical protein